MVPKAIKTRTMIDALHDFRDSTGGRPDPWLVWLRVEDIVRIVWRVIRL